MLAEISGWLLYPTITLFIFICVILIMLVLVQKGRGGGLIGAFGGMGGNTAFGAKTGDVLTWATSIIFGVFLLLAVLLNLMAGTTSTSATPAAGDATAPTNSSLPAKAPTTK